MRTLHCRSPQRLTTYKPFEWRLYPLRTIATCSCSLANATVSGVFPLPPTVRFPTLIIGKPNFIFVALKRLISTIRHYRTVKGSKRMERARWKRVGRNRYCSPQETSKRLNTCFSNLFNLFTDIENFIIGKCVVDRQGKDLLVVGKCYWEIIDP